MQATSNAAPVGTESLAQGEDEVAIAYTVVARNARFTKRTFACVVATTWNEVFASIAPAMIDEATEPTLRGELSRLVTKLDLEAMRAKAGDDEVQSINVAHSDFQTLKVQFLALGLIAMSPKEHGVKDTATYFTLTPYGNSVMTRLRAIRRPVAGSHVAAEPGGDTAG